MSLLRPGEDRGVAYDDEERSGARDSDVEALWVVEEPKVVLEVEGNELV